jgi:hypothetical protein
MADRPAFVTLRLTNPRQNHPTVAWLQQLINVKSPRYVRGLVVDGEFGPQTATETEEFLYRLGRKESIPAIGKGDVERLYHWSEGGKLPADWQARRIARMAVGFRRGWGIAPTSWRLLHPGAYDPAKAADVMLGWEKQGWDESPSGSNVVPAMVSLARSLQVRSDVVGMGYAWCQFSAYLAGLVAGGQTAKLGLVDRSFWPLYTPYTLAFGQRGEYGHTLVSAANARKGDMAMFNFGSRDVVQHVGRLIEPPGQTVVTVDGNTSTTSEDNGGRVMIRERSASTVVGYVRDA